MAPKLTSRQLSRGSPYVADESAGEPGWRQSCGSSWDAIVADLGRKSSPTPLAVGWRLDEMPLPIMGVGRAVFITHFYRK